MNKFLLLIVIVFATTLKAFSQNKPQPDSVAYLMKSDLEITDNQQLAQFLRLVIKADSGMCHIQDYYMDSKPRLVAKSFVGDADYLKGAHGVSYEFYKNGSKRSIVNYNRGKLSGEALYYYPNGKLYKQENHAPDGAYLKTCLDSTGVLLTTNGNGKSVDFDAYFKIIEEGPIVNGKKDGVWRNYANDRAADYYYNMGVQGKLDSFPSFKGGDKGFIAYLAKAIKYTDDARSRDIQGRVILTFFVEKDGSVADVKVIRGIDAALDKRALEAIQNMPKWLPGMFRGQAVRVQCTVPVGYSLIDKLLNPLENRPMQSRF